MEILLYSKLNNYFNSEEGSVLIGQLEEFKNYRLLAARTVSLTIPSSNF